MHAWTIVSVLVQAVTVSLLRQAMCFDSLTAAVVASQAICGRRSAHRH